MSRAQYELLLELAKQVALIGGDEDALLPLLTRVIVEEGAEQAEFADKVMRGMSISQEGR